MSTPTSAKRTISVESQNTIPSDLPPFVARWVQQWKNAAPRLQAMRDEELRRRGSGQSRCVAGHRIYDRNPHNHGLVIMQCLFMRRYLPRQMEQNTIETSRSAAKRNWIDRGWKANSPS